MGMKNRITTKIIQLRGLPVEKNAIIIGTDSDWQLVIGTWVDVVTWRFRVSAWVNKYGYISENHSQFMNINILIIVFSLLNEIISLNIAKLRLDKCRYNIIISNPCFGAVSIDSRVVRDRKRTRPFHMEGGARLGWACLGSGRLGHSGEPGRGWFCRFVEK